MRARLRSARWFWPLLLVPTLLAGVWLRKDALDSGFLSDDYAQRAMLHDRYPVKRAPWDLYNFSDGTAAGTRPLIAAGFCPWWTHPGFKLRMLRPLPSLLHALDDQLFPGSARLQHLHSLLWWVLMVLAAAGLLAAVLPRAAAACAVVLFALDDSHAAPLFWIANRNTLCAMAFACAALWAHVMWRRGGRAAARPLSIALFALALSAGEYGLTMAGYLVCFELLSSFDTGPSRLRALAPALATCALYLVVALGLGYGTAHSGLYTSPITDPGGYLGKLTFGVPLLLGDLVLGNSADIFRFDHGSHMRAVLVNFGILGALCLIALIVWLARRRDRTHWLSVRWLVAGAGLALLPVLGSFLSSRLVMPASLGFFALLGTSVAYAARAIPRAPRIHGALAVALLAFVLYVDVYRAADFGPGVLQAYQYIARSLTVWPLSAKLDDAHAASQRVVLITADDQEAAPFFSFVRYGNRKTMPKAFWMLSGARSAHELKRVDANTIELHVLATGEALQQTFLGSQTRASTDSMHVGDHFDVPGMRVDVLELLQGQPVRMRYRFDVPLEDRSLVFVQSAPTGLRPLVLPAPGETLLLAPPAPPDYRKATSIVAPPAAAGT
jgi:hypothetical protein